ncbi:hypothetical protein D9756_001806 [Leucocoprinus leucothites]|uniref:Cytoplasmic protein n=1 Tax=Leucocoprinus leucothites TaxID=201217 RepID=A0A8H5LI00_9AGAR|nr:hypothetical protein D9756_001806 [Leucoagaricus leucothites]
MNHSTRTHSDQDLTSLLTGFIMEPSEISSTTTNLTRAKTSATLTVRIIKSFEFRTEKSLVLHNINLETTTVGQLKDIARQAVQTQPGWKPYRNVSLDTLKLYTRAHGAKTSNLIINLDHDDWILDDDNRTLVDLGFENETETSFFNRELYEQFKLDPQTSWDC